MVDEVIDLSKDFDISFLTDEDEESKYQAQVENSQKKIDDLYNAIGAFIKKLKSNPKATTIKWPERIPDIEKFETQINTIYKG